MIRLPSEVPCTPSFVASWGSLSTWRTPGAPIVGVASQNIHIVLVKHLGNDHSAPAGPWCNTNSTSHSSSICAPSSSSFSLSGSASSFEASFNNTAGALSTKSLAWEDEMG